MTTFPKSIEAPITRFFHTPVTWSKGVRNGGMTAVLKPSEGDWNDVLVYEPDSPGENWWDLVPRGTVIRASIREPGKKNPRDLIAFALPLKNQPTATQELIKSLQSEEITEETKPGLTHSDMVEDVKRLKDQGQELTPSQKMFNEQNVEKSDVDKLEEQIQDGIRKKVIRQTEFRRIQRLTLRGEWLEGNEKALIMAHGMIANAFFAWCEDHSDNADSKCLHEMMDAVHYIIEIGAKLRGANWSLDKEYDGALYLKDANGEPVKVIDLNELP